MFERVARDVTNGRPAARVVSSELGPLTIIDALPKDARRDLSSVSRITAALVAEQQKLIERESRLAASQDDASRGSSGVATDTLDRVVTELGDAKALAGKKRAEITAGLERIRLELIRLRSGIGSVADVRTEAEKASRLLSSD